MTVRVLVVDDNPVVRMGLESLLESSGQCTVVAQAGDGESAVALAQTCRADVTLLDVRMPRLDGVGALARLVPLTRVLMLTYTDDDDVVLAALRAGASGYLVHGQLGAPELTAAVIATAAGHQILGSSAAEAVRRALSGPAAPPPGALPRPDVWGLTEREADVLERMADGRSNAEIAAACFLSEKTVKNHVNHIFAKLGARSRAEAVSLWLQRAPVR